MIDDQTHGAFTAARAFSDKCGIETRRQFENFISLLTTYYYSYDETVCILEQTIGQRGHCFLASVNRPTRRGPRLVDTLELRYVEEPKPVDDFGIQVTRTEPITPGWHLTAAGRGVSQSPHRRPS